MCEPIAFKGIFGGQPEPEPRRAAHASRRRAHRLGRRTQRDDPDRRRGRRPAGPPRLRVDRARIDAGRPDELRGPGPWRHRPVGRRPRSVRPRRRGDPDDLRRLRRPGDRQLRAARPADRQQAELEHQLASQRRLLEVNERLLSTRDPKGILELIADSLKTIVPYDTLTIYRCDFEAGVRRAVVARDRFAEVILDYAGSDRGRNHRLGDRSRRGSPRQRRAISILAPSRSPARRSSPSR